MTEDEARAQLERMVAFDSAPDLSPDDIDALLLFAGGTDPWALNAAAAEGWRWKAGKVAGAYSFSIDQQSSDQGQVHAFCLEQAVLYDRLAELDGLRSRGSMRVLAIRSPLARAIVVDDLPDPG